MSRPFLGAVAQLGERGLCKPEVVGSTPISSIHLDADLQRINTNYMPLYDYECASCSHTVEIRHSMHGDLDLLCKS